MGGTGREEREGGGEVREKRGKVGSGREGGWGDGERRGCWVLEVGDEVQGAWQQTTRISSIHVSCNADESCAMHVTHSHNAIKCNMNLRSTSQCVLRLMLL